MTTGTKHMNERSTPGTDAFREIVIQQYKKNELTGDGMDNILHAFTDIEILERERNEARNAMAQARGELDLKTLDFERMREQRDKLSKQLAAERALADRLAEAIQNYLVLDENIDATTDELNGSWEQLQSSITAWKEARSE